MLFEIIVIIINIIYTSVYVIYRRYNNNSDVEEEVPNSGSCHRLLVYEDYDYY